MKWPLPRIFGIPLALLFSIAQGLSDNHPGAPYTRRDLEIAKSRAAAGKAPWTEAREYLLLEASEALKLPITSPPAKLVIPRRYADAAGHMKAREKIGTDAWAAQSLALGAWMAEDKTRSEAYAKKAIDILMAWTICEDMGHLSDDQKEAALVSCATGNGLIVAADLLYENPLWAEADREKFLRWVKASYLPATEIRGIGYGNNWECWGIYATLLSSHLLDDRALFAKAEKLLLDDIEKQIAGDGSMPKELARGAGKHWYTYYALTPMILGAKVVEDATDNKLLDPATSSGKRIASAVAYFMANLEYPPYRDLIEGYGGITNNETCLKDNLGSRPITGNRAHSGWNFPTLFLRPEVVPANRAPEVAVSPPPPSVKAGTEFILDAAASSDPDGRIREILWISPVDPETTNFDSVLRSPSDVVEFKEPFASDFTLSFTLKMNRDANAALGLQSEADTGKDWGGSSFLVNTKDGLLKVRDGARYRAEHDIRCQPGLPVKIRMVVRPLRQTCDVHADTGSGETMLANDYSIREDKKMRGDIRRVRYLGEEGAEISDIVLANSQRTQKGPKGRFVFDRPGTYHIQLVVIDDLGAKATRDLPVTIVP